MSTGSAQATRDARLAFVLGGSLLAASGVIDIVQALIPFAAIPNVRALGATYYPLALVSAGLFAAALIIFAWGIRREGSVVARRAAGVVSLMVLGLWGVVGMLLFPPLFAGAGGETAAAYLLLFAWFLAQLVVAVLAVVAGVVIVRARVVPRGWRWVPLAAILLGVASGLLNSTGLFGVFAFPDLPFGILAWADAATPAILGILAIGLGLAAGRGPEEPTAQTYLVPPQPSEPVV
ncbi:hypothetical protein ACH3VR_09480 [Microbacterium sp. B2969]|uniref:DUF998 domain-containing protein n=1 Tax=Microbacterium alkaliflavum TaxID=3248839 RepID=A0ABW7Q6W1_9MICO